MPRLDLGRRFGIAFIAFRAFQHLLTVDEQWATLTGVRRHLRPDGRLALHLFDPRFDLLADENPPAIRQSGIDPATQRRYYFLKAVATSAIKRAISSLTWLCGFRPTLK